MFKLFFFSKHLQFKTFAQTPHLEGWLNIQMAIDQDSLLAWIITKFSKENWRQINHRSIMHCLSHKYKNRLSGSNYRDTTNTLCFIMKII